MKEFEYSDYFESEPSENFGFLRPFNPPWDIPGRIAGHISKRLETLRAEAEENNYEKFLRINHNGADSDITVVAGFVTEKPLFIKKQGIFIDTNTRLEFGALIRSHTLIGKNCEIRQSAYVRGNVAVGDNCVIGHTTEIKNSVLIHHVECGHFNYIGDSIVGSYVNLGAGSVLSNLNFRTLSQKKAGEFPPLKLRDAEGNQIKGPSKFGCIIGDGTETGCNCVIAPGAIIGKNSLIYPCIFLPKGFYPPDSKIKSVSF